MITEDTKIIGWTIDALKPCPFCGSPAELIEGISTTLKGNKRKVYEVVCTNEKCFIYQGVTRFQDTPGVAIRLWNKRIKSTQSK